jgi:hypothetical protein
MPAPKGHPPYSLNGGRPIKYTEEYIENEANELEIWMKKEDSIWFKDFALERGYHPDQLVNWSKQNETFSCAYNRLKAWQESVLVKGGLKKKYNSAIVAMSLCNNHGWKNKVETTVIGDVANPVAFALDQVSGTSKDLVNDNS